MSALLLLALVAQLGPPRPTGAATLVEVKLEASGAWTVDLHADLDALLLGLSSAAPAGQRLAGMESLRAAGRAAEAAAIDRLAEYLRRRLRVRFDGTAAAPVVAFPERRAMANGELATLGSRARLRGSAPAGARRFTFFASRSFGGVDLRVDAGGARSRQIVEPGAESEPVALP